MLKDVVVSHETENLPAIHVTCKFDKGEDLNLAIPPGAPMYEVGNLFIDFGLFIRNRAKELG